MNNKENISSISEKIAGKALWELTRSINFKVDDPDGNFIFAQDALESGKSLIIYLNHTSKFDPVIAARFADRYLNTPLNKVTGVAGLKHYDPDRKESNQHIINATKLVEKHTGLQKVLVIQDYDIKSYDSPSIATNFKSAKRFNAESYLKIGKILNSPGNVLFIAPEGTRSNDGILNKSDVDLERLLKLSGDKTLAMPLAIIPPEKGKIKPLISNVLVKPGKLIDIAYLEFLKKIRPEFTGTDLLMRSLAHLLPANKKGYYV